MQTHPGRFENIGAGAAFGNAFAALAALVVAVGLIGLDALTDPRKLVELALENPAPLLVQDVLKCVSAATALVLINVLYRRLRGAAPRLMRVATACGLLAVAGLLVNASLSMYAISQAVNFSQSASAVGNALNGVIGVLGMAVILANGIWYLLVNWAALKNLALPRGLGWLGMVVGAMGLAPFLALGGLVLGAVWALWLGIFWWRAK